MEDVYRIQVSVQIRNRIFGELKEQTEDLMKADAATVSLTKSMKALRDAMMGVGKAGSSVLSPFVRMASVFGDASAGATSMNRRLTTSIRRLSEVAKEA